MTDELGVELLDLFVDAVFSVVWFGRAGGGGAKDREEDVEVEEKKGNRASSRSLHAFLRFSLSLSLSPFLSPFLPFSFLFFIPLLNTHVSPRVVSLSPASSSVGTFGGGFLVPKMRRMVIAPVEQRSQTLFFFFSSRGRGASCCRCESASARVRERGGCVLLPTRESSKKRGRGGEREGEGEE